MEARIRELIEWHQNWVDEYSKEYYKDDQRAQTSKNFHTHFVEELKSILESR